MGEPARDYKYSLTIRKRIPSSRQFQGSDEISATVRWDDGEGLSWHERFQCLNEATDQAIREWLNPTVAPAAQELQPTPARLELKPPAEPEIDRLPWKLFPESDSAGWIRRDLDDPVVRQLRAYLEAQEKLPMVIGKFRYRISGPKDNPRMCISRAPVEKT